MQFLEKLQKIWKKIRNIKVVRTKRRRKYLVSEPNYDTIKFFPENVLAIEMKKNQRYLLMNIYLVLSIIESSTILMYKFWYDYIKPKYGKRVKLCSMDTDSFTVHIKADDIYKDIAEDVATRFDTSHYKLDKPLPKRKKLKKQFD